MSDKIGFDKLTFNGVEIELTGGDPMGPVMVSRKELMQLQAENAELRELIKWCKQQADKLNLSAGWSPLGAPDSAWEVFDYGSEKQRIEEIVKEKS